MLRTTVRQRKLTCIFLNKLERILTIFLKTPVDSEDTSSWFLGVVNCHEHVIHAHINVCEFHAIFVPGVLHLQVGRIAGADNMEHALTWPYNRDEGSFNRLALDVCLSLHALTWPHNRDEACFHRLALDVCLSLHALTWPHNRDESSF